MVFLKNNVNFFLLILIVLLIASFTSFTLYYNNKYTNLTTTYAETMQLLAQTTEEKILREKQLNQTLAEFELKVDREQDLSSKYSGIREVNQNLSEELQDKILTLAQINNELRQAKDELTTAKQDLATKTNELNAANEEIDDLQEENNELEDQLDACQP